MIAPKPLLIFLALAALIAGCGGGSSKSKTDPPKASPTQIPLPKQPLSQWASQFQAAAKASDCAAMKKLGVRDPCAKLRRVYGGVKVVKTQQFKTAAVLDLSNRWILLANEAGNRGWTASSGLDVGHASAGSTDPAAARNSATRTFEAVASQNCPQFYKWANTPGVLPSQKQKVCQSAFKGLTAIYKQNRSAKPVALGGTKDAQFFGYFLRNGRHRYYATVVVIHDPKATPHWLTLAPVPVPIPAK